MNSEEYGYKRFNYIRQNKSIRIRLIVKFISYTLIMFFFKFKEIVNNFVDITT